MYSPPILAYKYLKYWLGAANGKGHGTHSPFIFQFIIHVLNDKKKYPEYERAESIRSQLLKNKQVLTLEDMGAGSSSSNKNERTIASIAKRAAKPKKYAQLLFRIAKYYQPLRILELGTSLGISTSYLCLAVPGAEVISIEGSKSVAAIARTNLSKLGITNCNVVEGNFDNVLPALLNQPSSRDLIFIDGNHRMEPTLRYFDWIQKTAKPGTILVFDDIHWSREMEMAWTSIKNDPVVKCSIDLFFFGLVFLREEFHEKQDFTIRF